MAGDLNTRAGESFNKRERAGREGDAVFYIFYIFILTKLLKY